MIRRLAVIAVIAALPLGPAGCTTIASGIASVVGKAQGPIPGQARTLAEAQHIAIIATDIAKGIVDTGKLSRAQLEQLDAFNEGLHAAVGKLETSNAKGESLSFAAFNAALAAWNAYTATLPKP